jgi:general secretion pathway protein G
MVRPRDAMNWHGPYMEKDIPLDPWGKPYSYQCPGRHNPSGYDLFTTDPSGNVYGNWTEKQR